MSFPLPRLAQRPSPNYSDRNGQKVRLIVVHDTEGAYASAIAWFQTPASRVSTQFVMREDGAEATQMVPTDKKAWHACAFNGVSIGIEGAGVASHGFSDGWWRGMAAMVAWLLIKYDLPVRWAQGGDGAGFCSHHDLGQAGGGHGDPCAIGSPDWQKFIGYVQDAFHELTAAPQPDWAFVMAPLASHLDPPRMAIPVASHQGAPRAEPGDVREAHPTASTYPRGSIADVQHMLAQLGHIVTIDGLYGPVTSYELSQFQRAHGLVADGVPGPLTIAALVAATQQAA